MYLLLSFRTDVCALNCTRQMTKMIVLLTSITGNIVSDLM